MWQLFGEAVYWHRVKDGQVVCHVWALAAFEVKALKANIESYFVAGSSKEATKTSVPSWSGRRNFNKSDTSVEGHLVRCALMVEQVTMQR